MQAVKKKRPVLISIICIIGYIWIVVTFPGMFSPAVKKIGAWYPALYGIFVASNFISFIGAWNMKRWGAELFIVTFFVKQVVNFMANDVSFVGIFLSVLFIIVFVVYYRRMDVNL